MTDVSDQVLGLEAASTLFNCIDMKRVAIFGCSYGGYVALMALIQRPDIFKVNSFLRILFALSCVKNAFFLVSSQSHLPLSHRGLYTRRRAPSALWACPMKTSTLIFATRWSTTLSRFQTSRSTNRIKVLFRSFISLVILIIGRIAC